MIELTTDQLMSTPMSQTLQKIARTPMDPYAAYRIKKVTKEIQDKQDKIRYRYKEEIEKVFAERDENGTIIPDETGARPFKVHADKKDKFLETQEAFGTSLLTLHVNKIAFDDIAAMKLSPAEMDSLEPILGEPKVAEQY